MSGNQDASGRPSRRGLIRGGVLGAAGAAAVSVLGVRAASRNGLIPPDCGGFFGIGETLNYATHRLLQSGGSQAREFSQSEISEKPFGNTRGGRPLFAGEEYKRLEAKGFADWRIKVEGMVERPLSLSLDDLKRMPAQTQITQLACEEGWSFIAAWTGASLGEVLAQAGVPERAKFAVYYSMEPGWWDSIDLVEARHPQTLLAYGMNGKELPAAHGAPVRMRVPRQLGYKSLKYVSRLVVTDDLKSFGKGLGSAAPEAGFSWYAGI